MYILLLLVLSNGLHTKLNPIGALSFRFQREMIPREFHIHRKLPGITDPHHLHHLRGHLFRVSPFLCFSVSARSLNITGLGNIDVGTDRKLRLSVHTVHFINEPIEFGLRQNSNIKPPIIGFNSQYILLQAEEHYGATQQIYYKSACTPLAPKWLLLLHL